MCGKSLKKGILKGGFGKWSLVLIFLFLLAGVSARNFTVYNSSNPSITYFIINGDNGRIGIGTATPQNMLNIIGDINATGIYYGNGSQLVGIKGSQINNDLNWINASTASGSYIPYIGSNANIVLGNYNFSIGTSDFFVDAAGGKVGVGTTSPQNNLNVVGDTNVTGNLYVESGGTLTGQYDFNGGWTNNGLSIIDGDIYAQTGYFYKINSLQVSTLKVNGSLIPESGFDNQFDLGNSTNRWRDLNLGRNAVIGGTAKITGDLAVNTNTLFVDVSSGKVGIGTASPQSKLNVVGDINATANLYGTLIYQNGNKVLDSLDNATIYSYIDSQDVLYNNSMKNYVDALNASQTSWTIENYVPYSGATKNVNLGTYNLSAGTLNSDNVDTGTINVTGDAKITGSIILGGANITANTNGDVNVW